MIYLDYAATTPMSDKAIEVYTAVAKKYYGNASSLHDIGSAASGILEASRRSIASFINADPKHLYFTSGGSEANLLVILSLLEGNSKKGKHLITTEAEHSSVRNVYKMLENKGYEVSWLPLDSEGKIKIDVLKESIREDTVLASIQHANSEIGTIQSIQEIADILHEREVLLHSDCVQTFGKLPLNVQEFGADAITFSSHKVYGPKGVGAAWINPGSNWSPFLPNIQHEKGFVQGTSDVASVASFAAAVKEMMDSRERMKTHFTELRTHLLSRLSGLDATVVIEGSQDDCLPNIIGVRIPGIEGQFLMLECSQAGVGIATGSACTSGSDQPSATMMSLGKTTQEAREFVRLSLGKMTSMAEIDQAINKIGVILDRHFSKVKI